MRMILVDCCREHTMIHRIDVTKGIYERPMYVKGHVGFIIDSVIEFMLKDRPDKIVIDKAYIGKTFEDSLLRALWERRRYYNYPVNIMIDDCGNITYGE